MAEGKQSKKTKGESKQTFTPKERRFLPVRDTRMTASLIAGGVGSLLLGAGVYIQFFRPSDNMLAVKLGAQVVEMADKGSYVVGLGAVILAAVILLAPDFETAVLVGDCGVGTDEGKEEGAKRLLWCDIEEITLKNQILVVQGSGTKITIPLASQPQAAAWVIKEVQERIPSIISLSHAEQEQIPRAEEDAGERRKVGDLQIAGRHCAASDRVISYEPDARLCPRCGEIYHKNNVPEECVTCEGPLGETAQRVG